MTNTMKTSLTVRLRANIGKSVSKTREVGYIPSNIFGKDQKSQSIEIERSSLMRFLKSEGDSGLLYLSIEGESKSEVPVLIDEIQANPVNEEVLHISFKRVNLKEKVQQEVAVEMIGEASVPGATILLTKDVLEVEALPADLPESIVLDISGLKKIDQSLYLSDAQYDRAKVTVLLSEEELESPLVLVQELKEEAAEEPADEAAPAEEDSKPAEEAATPESES